MELENEKDSSENLNNDSSLLSSGNEMTSNIEDNKDDINQSDTLLNTQSLPVKIIIEEDKSKDLNGRIGNYVSMAALILAAIALYYNVKLYRETEEANSISKKALKLANDQFEQSRTDNELARVERQKASEESYKRYRQQFILDSQSVDAQIKAFQASQEKSELENRPFVQVFNISIDTSRNIGSIRFTVFNFGKYPARIEYVKYRIGVALAISPEKVIYLKWEDNDRKTYIASGLNSLPEISFMKANSNDAIKVFKDGQVITYLDVEIKYTSYITKKTFLHTSLNEIRYGNFVRSVTNKDIEIKN